MAQNENLLAELDDQQLRDFACFLYETSGLDKNKVGEFLGKSKPFNQRVLAVFFEQFNLKSLAADLAMRLIFRYLRLPNEF